MAGIAAKSILIICCQLLGMNQFSHCHKKTQMKSRRPNSDARNGVALRHCEGAGSELNLPKDSWIHWTFLNQMDEIFKVWIKKKPIPQKTSHTQRQTVNFTHAKT